MRYDFIINPRAGNHKKARRVQSLIHELLDNSDQVEYGLHMTEYAGHAYKLAKAAADKGADVAVAVGGDGTMNEVANGLVHTDTALGVLPAGSGNGFARSMNIPLNLRKAMRFLLEPEIHSIDAGNINDTMFFGVAGIGFDAVIGQKFQELSNRGPIPYFYIGIREFLRYKYQPFTLITNDKKERLSPLLIAFANTPQYGIGASIAPGADFTDGLLEICTLQRLDIMEAVLKLAYLFQGKIHLLDAHSMFKAKSVQILSETTPILYHTDGEPRQGTHELDIKIIPGALKAVCRINNRIR